MLDAASEDSRMMPVSLVAKPSTATAAPVAASPTPEKLERSPSDSALAPRMGALAVLIVWPIRLPDNSPADAAAPANALL